MVGCGVVLAVVAVRLVGWLRYEQRTKGRNERNVYKGIKRGIKWGSSAVCPSARQRLH